MQSNSGLVTDNVKLVYFIYEKLGKNEITVHYKDDIVAEGMVGLVKAAKNFDESKGYTFATYAARCIRNEMLMFMRKLNKQVPHEISLDAAICTDKEGGELRIIDLLEAENGNPEDGLERAAFEEFMSTQKPQDRLLVSLIRKGYKQKEIGEVLGVTQSIVSRRIAKLKKRFRNVSF